MTRVQLDRNRQLLLIWRKGEERWKDATFEATAIYAQPNGGFKISFGEKFYPYAPSSVRILNAEGGGSFAQGDYAEVAGRPWGPLTHYDTFGNGTWIRLWYRRRGQLTGATFHVSEVTLITRDSQPDAVQDAMSYFQVLVSNLPDDDPLRFAFERLGPVHPQSALATWLTAGPISSQNRTDGMSRIYPFSSNKSQRDALQAALSNSISVIDGPPGTGKTQTILNLVANLVTDQKTTVAVVSHGNAAVNNIYEKLESSELDFIAAPLGSRERITEFLETHQHTRNGKLARFKARLPEPDHRRLLPELNRKVAHFHNLQRTFAETSNYLTALTEEMSLFLVRHGQPAALPASLQNLDANLALRLLGELDRRWVGRLKPSWLDRLRWWWHTRMSLKLRATDLADPADLSTKLQWHAYRHLHANAVISSDSLRSSLSNPELVGATQQLSAVSLSALRSALRDRYSALKLETYSSDDLWQKRAEFSEDYPVLLSTCHSLPRVAGRGRLLDYVIIDEASQVDLLTAVLALSRARRVVIVGDENQLPPIPEDIAGLARPPHSAYDYATKSILTSVLELYEDHVPRVLLREHYRCHPEIIGFCNQKFYGGQLIPMRDANQDRFRPQTHRPIRAVLTAPGDHARRFTGGGWINQREQEVISQEVLPDVFSRHGAAEIGLISPFRRQAEDLAAQGIEADTVHKFQGREKSAVLFSAVVDSRHEGSQLVEFVDDPRMINVAVSRAQEEFVLIANPELPTEAHNLRDLLGYIERKHDTALQMSRVVSVFDLLYKSYASALKSLNQNLKGRTEYRSEEAVLVTLERILPQVNQNATTPLKLNHQVFLRDLLPHLDLLTDAERGFVQRGASADFVISNAVTGAVLGIIEVDGFHFHANNPKQLSRDRLKDSAVGKYGVAVLRLETTGSGEERKITDFLRTLSSGP